MPYEDSVIMKDKVKIIMDEFNKNKHDVGLISKYTKYGLSDCDNYLCMICKRTLRRSSRNSHLKTLNHLSNFNRYYKFNYKTGKPIDMTTGITISYR